MNIHTSYTCKYLIKCSSTQNGVARIQEIIALPAALYDKKDANLNTTKAKVRITLVLITLS